LWLLVTIVGVGEGGDKGQMNDIKKMEEEGSGAPEREALSRKACWPHTCHARHDLASSISRQDKDGFRIIRLR
jgi:hypothetical protein